MIRKLLVALIASAFTLGAYAQAPKSDTTKAEPKGQTGTTTEKATPGKGEVKGEKKKAKAAKTDGEKTKDGAKSKDAAKAKDSRKDATTTAPATDTKKDAKK